MSLTKSNSNEPGAAKTNSSPWRSFIASVVVTIGLLGALVAALKPSRPPLVPAALRPAPPGCPKVLGEFTPTNLTEVPGLTLDGSAKEKNRALLRLNLEPCSCGCGMSLAACRAANPSCENSRGEAQRVAAEEKGQADRKPGNSAGHGACTE